MTLRSQLAAKKDTSPRRNLKLVYSSMLKQNGNSIISMLKLLGFVAMILTVWSCGRNDPLSTYGPKSPQEAAIKSMLMEFEQGVNMRDAKKIESLIHENASIMVGRERKILSKAAYRKILPKRLADNPPIALGKPKMRVSGDKAEVRIYLTRGSYDGLVVYNMKQENSKWYILSWRY